MDLKNKKELGLFRFKIYNNFQICFKILNFLKKLFVVPIIILIFVIRPILKIKFGKIKTKTIGNSTYCMEVFLAEIKSGIHDKKNFLYIWYTDAIISNSFWLKKLKKQFIILPGILIDPIYQILSINLFHKLFIVPIRKYHGEKNYFKIKSINNLYPTVDIHNVKKNNQNYICNFNKKEIDEGENYLIKLGIKPNDKYICFSSRSDSYLNEKFKSVRNADIDTYKDGIFYLNSKGYKAIRMGRSEKKEINWSNENIIDYSTRSDQSDFLDFYVISKCKFVITSASGIKEIGSVFGKKSLMMNYFNLRNLINEDGKYVKIVLPKKILNKSTDKLLNYKFLVKSNIYFESKSEEDFSSNGYTAINNSSDEIKFAIIEMLDLFEKDFKSHTLNNQYEFFKIYQDTFNNINFNNCTINKDFYEMNKNLFI